MRIKLTETSLSQLFNGVFRKFGTAISVASFLGVSSRTIRDWKNGISLIPDSAFKKMVRISGAALSRLSFKSLPDYWNASDAARKGGYARILQYGDLGTPDGRRKGGIQSLITHARLKTRFNAIPRKIRSPAQSERLAEFMGIVIGDGHLSYYQTSVTTNSVTDMHHALFVQNLFYELFGLSANLKVRDSQNTVNVVASSKNLVLLLNKLGMPIGNKIQRGLSIPRWIKANRSYLKTFIRGLFDTDGSVYLDSHVFKTKTYSYLGWTITSYSATLLRDVVLGLEKLGFTPTQKSSQKSVFLRKGMEIKRYFTEIGSSNQKHMKRYQKFNGRVPKWS